MSQYIPYAMIGFGTSLAWVNHQSKESPWLTALALLGVALWIISARLDHQIRKLQKQIDKTRKTQP